MERLQRSLVGLAYQAVREFILWAGNGPIWRGRLRNLILAIAAKPDGEAVALEILHMRLHTDKEEHRVPAPEILHAGRELLRRAPLTNASVGDNYHLGGVAKACLLGEEGAELAEEVCRNLYGQASNPANFMSDHHYLLEGLLTAGRMQALNGLFGGNEEKRESGMRFIQSIATLARIPLDAVFPRSLLLQWCADGRS